MQPLHIYRERLSQREARAARLERSHARIANVRLGIFVFAVAAGWWLFAQARLSPWWLVTLVVAFIATALHHGRIAAARRRAERAAAFYRRGLERIEDRWVGGGSWGERFDDPHHVYAADLDLFGRGALFELLCTARTRMGEETLARWLLAPSSAAEVRARQTSVVDLRERLDLREQAALLGEDEAVGVQPQLLLAWAAQPSGAASRRLRALGFALPAAAIAAAALWVASGLLSPLVAVLVAELALLRYVRSRTSALVRSAEAAFENLRLLAGLARVFEHAQFTAERLASLQRKLCVQEEPASRAIAKLATLVQLLESRRNPLLAVLDAPLLYTFNVAQFVERWRAQHGAALHGWLDALGELEALLAVAAYSFEHPEDPFAEFVEGPATFAAEALGHPLLSAAACVRNDVAVCEPTRVLLISGSNMSGKSTLLRAIGVNVVLAMAGAPVRARRLRLSPLQVGASIRINDSLQEGSSRFYAEITRLRALNELLRGERLPLLFLLDELLQGTNSHDRRIGAAGVVRAFVERGAIGLITTHDLALTDLGAAIGGRLRNVHFEDELVDGRMRFDFRLREGVVTRSNGLALMRSIGLEV